MASLCIACCSTLAKSGSGAYTTSCCNKQICSPCLQANPRLRYYNPCLACCGAVQVVEATAQKSIFKEYSSPYTEQQKREENTFVIGDEDDDQESGDPFEQSAAQSEEPPIASPSTETTSDRSRAEEMVEHCSPAKYWLKKGDTLHGISLRFKINGRETCKLNGLPASTLSTTPHLLHTRAFIMLPPTDRKPPPPPPDAKENEERGKKERAAKQFQFVTKEVDWGIAKAYVALADSSEVDDDYGMKRKEAGRPIEGGGTGGAVERYMDDDEWEREQIKAGLSPRILPFPFLVSKS